MLTTSAVSSSASDIADQFKHDLDAFEQCERQLLRDERFERAQQLRARFSGLDLAVGR